MFPTRQSPTGIWFHGCVSSVRDWESQGAECRLVPAQKQVCRRSHPARPTTSTNPHPGIECPARFGAPRLLLQIDYGGIHVAESRYTPAEDSDVLGRRSDDRIDPSCEGRNRTLPRGRFRAKRPILWAAFRSTRCAPNDGAPIQWRSCGVRVLLPWSRSFSCAEVSADSVGGGTGFDIICWHTACRLQSASPLISRYGSDSMLFVPRRLPKRRPN